jgi:hypothetical protein
VSSNRYDGLADVIREVYVGSTEPTQLDLFFTLAGFKGRTEISNEVFIYTPYIPSYAQARIRTPADTQNNPSQ